MTSDISARVLAGLRADFEEWLSGLSEAEQYRELQSGAYPTLFDAEQLLLSGEADRYL